MCYCTTHRGRSRKSHISKSYIPAKRSLVSWREIFPPAIVQCGLLAASVGAAFVLWVTLEAQESGDSPSPMLDIIYFHRHDSAQTVAWFDILMWNKQPPAHWLILISTRCLCSPPPCLPTASRPSLFLLLRLFKSDDPRLCRAINGCTASWLQM